MRHTKGNSTVITILIIIILAAGVWYWLSTQEGTRMNDISISPSPAASVSPDPTNGIEIDANVSIGGQVREFTVSTAPNFRFDTQEIRVKRGDRVRVTFVNKGGTHDFVIDEFGVQTETLDEENEQDTVEFTADRAGTFEYYCSVVTEMGSHRLMGMVGKLIVE